MLVPVPAALCCQRMPALLLPRVPLLRDSSHVVCTPNLTGNGLPGFPGTARCERGWSRLCGGGSSAGRPGSLSEAQAGLSVPCAGWRCPCGIRKARGHFSLTKV